MATILLGILSLSYAVAKDFTVSGLGSGAFMASQLHITYSENVLGAGLIGGGPYYCTLGSRIYAESVCRRHADLILDQSLMTHIEFAAEKGKIDPIVNLEQSSVYIIGGALDTEVYPEVVKKTEDLYKMLITDGTIIANYTIEAQHGWITDNAGNPCDVLGTPYINQCGVDVAGEFFKLFNSAATKGTAVKANIKEFSQSKLAEYAGSEMAINGYYYQPTGCTDDSCDLHVALHDCYQEYENIGDLFITENGLNDWAEGSNVIILYPQVSKSNANNPYGCWDIWGYTGADYSNNEGPQMEMLFYMTQNLQEILS